MRLAIERHWRGLGILAALLLSFAVVWLAASVVNLNHRADIQRELIDQRRIDSEQIAADVAAIRQRIEDLADQGPTVIYCRESTSGSILLTCDAAPPARSR